MKGRQLGPYVIQGELASGGMGTVYVATHSRLGHVVGMKILHPHYQKDDSLRSRFVDEARIQANLRHPNILMVQDILELPDASGMVMELLDGCSLATWYRIAGLPLPVGQVLHLFASLANALNHAHNDGVVHRDLKPANIFLHRLHRDAVPKLMDFGVAKMRQETSAPRNTATGTVLGTPHYMAPEQFEDSSAVDQRADIFSMGVMLYEATTGLLPFEGRTITSIMKQILTHTPKRPSELLSDFPPGLERVILRCLQKHRHLRHRNAAELEAELRQLGTELGTLTIPADSVPNLDLESLGFDVTSIGTQTQDTLLESEFGRVTPDAPTISASISESRLRLTPDFDEAVDAESTADADDDLNLTPRTAGLPGYRVTEKIHEGRETIVYRGVTSGPERRPVIIKMLVDEYPSPGQVARLKHEYKIARGLTLDGVPRVLGLERFRNSVAIVIEDIGAQPLRNRTGGPLDLVELLKLAARLAHILGQLHAQGIVHRDINPRNIVRNEQTGNLQIIDFGLASLIPDQRGEAVAPNSLEGTLAYISPEQTGRMNRGVDYRTDFYSLGITLYELACGKRPFDATDATELVHCHLAVRPASPREVRPDLPGPLSDIIMKLIAKTAEERYQSGRGLKADLDECLRRYLEAGRIDPFPLARRDLSDRFQIPEKLYGRENEIKHLLAGFTRVSQGYKELMLVSGYSGIGKTSLVREVYKPITRQRGYFITGKFDQYKRDIPYGAMIDAFQGLVRQLLTEGNDQLDSWRTDLVEALGPNGQVIIDVIPEVEHIIGPQPPAADLPPAEALNRLNLVFRNFIRVFATQDHPLVLFLDDLQWADNASLNLVSLLLTGAGSEHLFLIGAYRDNEVDAAHPLQLTVDELTKTGAPVQNISLAPLDLAHINQLVADTVNCSLQDSTPLASLVHAKTQGNPFFIGEFLKSLHDQKLITFNIHSARWEWDLALIQAEQITDNVVDLMAEKIRKLKSATQQALKLAACIGNQFDLQSLAVVSGRSAGDITDALTEAVREGLLVLLGEAYKFLGLDSRELSDGLLDSVLLRSVRYKFAHDKIQQAAYSLIPSDARQTLHRQIGLLILQDTPAEERERRIFDIVNQLNAGRDLASSAAERSQLAGLNLQAGRRAKASAAYKTAYNYFRTGLELLPDDPWGNVYDTALGLHEEAAEAAYLCTRFAEMDGHVDEVLAHAATLEHKIKSYEVRIQGCIAQGKKNDAIRTGLSVMRLLGIRIHESPGKVHVLAGLLRTRLALGRTRIADLAGLPPMTDPRILTAMRIATKISSTAYVVNPNLFPALVLKQVELSARFGNCDVSPFAYALYGTILCGVLGSIERGYRFGKLALDLQQKLDAREFLAKGTFTAAATSQHYCEPLVNTLEPLLKGYRLALENGDFEFAGTNAGIYSYYLFFSGRALRETHDEIAYYAGVLDQLKQEGYLLYTRLYLQATQNLLGDNDDPVRLVGDAFNEDESLPAMQEAADGHGIFNLYLHRLMLAYFMEDYEKACADADVAREFLFSNAGMFPHTIFHFYDSLARLATCTAADPATCRRHMARARANQKRLRKWADHAPDNNLHKWLLVEAEIHRVKGNHVDAMNLYDRAIRAAEENGFQQEKALACEVAGRFYLQIDKERIARTYLMDAHYEYLHWGAQAKVNQLQERHAEMLGPAISATRFNPDPSTVHSTRSSTQTTSRTGKDKLDMNAVLKASQVISSEIRLDRLLEQMTRIVVETAGAQRGLLILEEDEKLFIEAEALPDAQGIVVLQHTPIRQREDIAQAVINYAMRLRECVALDDAANRGNFSRDEYILRERPKSLLCLPLVHQGELTGLLYLENNLATGAFTPGRQEVLHMLASEIVISLQNARLYADLEKHNRMLEVKVRDRTRDLRDLNRELEMEKEKADKLLLNVLPRKVAEDLKDKGYTDPELFPEATVLFSDFVGFTGKAADLPPGTLINELNEIFSAFDGIFVGNHCERIKTIGDAYLGVCGMPEKSDSHAENIVRAAVEMTQYLRERNRTAEFQWEMRIGIHSGPVVGAVVGIDKYIYDVFGDTINVASRLEGLSQPMQITISQATWDHIKNRFDAVPLGAVEVKGKGPMNLYSIRFEA